MELRDIVRFRSIGGIIQAKYEDKPKDYVPLRVSILTLNSGFKVATSYVNKYVRVNVPTDVNISIDSVEFEIGDMVTFEQTGVGAFTITPLNNTVLNGSLTSAGQFSVLQVLKVDAVSWTIIGGIDNV